MSQQTLFLAWQDQRTGRRWFPIGRLDVERPRSLYRFRYTGGAQLAQQVSFSPLPDFPAFDRAYEAADLFPLFKNRVMGASRPDFGEYIQQLGLDVAHSDPIEILAISGGTKATDSFEVFPQLQASTDGSFRCRFFLHGALHVGEPAQRRIDALATGERLNLTLELTNPVTGTAVQVQTDDDCVIGWAPRYLVDDLAQAIAGSPGRFDAEVVRLNPLPAPSRHRLLVELRGHWPQDYDPMSSDQFKPLVP